MAKNHLMLDIETLDLKPTAAVLSIAATFFDPFTGQLGASFERQINLKSCIDLGLTVDPETIMWWMEQSKEAQEAFRGNSKAEGLGEVLCAFSKWVNYELSFLRDRRGFSVWGNGKDFDCVIMENAYRAAGLKSLTPWKFWETVDVRTLVALAHAAGCEDFKANTPFEGTRHNALDDVSHQIKYVVKYFNHMMGG